MDDTLAVKKSTLSVVMPNYNHARYIGETLDSILSQSLRPWEVIVVDDASTDDSVEVIERFVKQDSILRLIRNERNMGVVHSVNRGVQCASGEYLSFASADDKILPGLYEKSMDLLGQFPQAGLCSTNWAMFNDERGVFFHNSLFRRERPCYFSPEELSREIKKLGYWPVSGVSTIIKRSVLIEAGSFIPGLRWYIDVFAALVVGVRYGVCYVPEVLAAMRLIPESYCQAGFRNSSAHRDIFRCLFGLLESPPYADVRSVIENTGVWPIFHHAMLTVLLKSPKRWKYLSPKLVRRALWHGLKRKFRPAMSPAVLRTYHFMRNAYCRAKGLPEQEVLSKIRTGP